jgi:hypothetical protein
VIETIWKNDKRSLVLLSLAVFLSRLPFISDGFGLDGDSWSVFISARHWNETGEYTASRLPGYPVHEFLSSVLSPLGDSGLNLISAASGAIAVLFFGLTLRLLRFRQVLLACAAMAAVPVIYIHSTTTIDYMPALAFIMSSMYFLLRGNLVVAGVLLGLATGCRITSGAMLIPFGILIAENDGLRNNLRRLLRLAVSTLVTALIVFLPVIATYGSGFFSYYNVPYPPVPKVLYKISIETWGVIGLAGIIISTGLLFLPDRITSKRFLFPRSVNERFVIAWLVAIDLYVIAFLKLPMEAGYLIPVVPFVIMIYGKYLYRKAFIFFCTMLIASAFLCTISPEERFDAATPSPASFTFTAGGEDLVFDLLKGPVLSYQTRRKNGIMFVDGLLSSLDTVSSRSVMVAGRWYNQLNVQAGDTSKLNIVVRDYLSESEALFYYAKGYEIYYLPKQDYYNKIMRNVDLEVYNARPYIHGKKN